MTISGQNFLTSWELKYIQELDVLYINIKLILGFSSFADWSEIKDKINNHCREKSCLGFRYEEELKEIYNQLAAGKNLDTVLEKLK